MPLPTLDEPYPAAPAGNKPSGSEAGGAGGYAVSDGGLGSNGGLGVGVGMGVLAPPTGASASSSSSSFGNKIWGLRVVDMRLLMTVDMRDRLFGYVLKFQEYFASDDIDGFRPRRLASSISTSLTENEEEEDQMNAAGGVGGGGGGDGGSEEKKKVKVLTDDDLKATARDFLPYWDKSNEKSDTSRGGGGIGKEVGVGLSGGRVGGRERGWEQRGERRRSRSTGSLPAGVGESRSISSGSLSGGSLDGGDEKVFGSEITTGGAGLRSGSRLGGLEGERGGGSGSGSGSGGRPRRSVSVDRGGGGGGSLATGTKGSLGGGTSTRGGGLSHASTSTSSSTSLSSSLSSSEYRADDVRRLLRMGVEGALDGSERLSRVREREKYYWGDTSQVRAPLPYIHRTSFSYYLPLFEFNSLHPYHIFTTPSHSFIIIAMTPVSSRSCWNFWRALYPPPRPAPAPRSTHKAQG